MEEKVINDLVYYKNLKIVQNKNYFNFSLDSVLLPNFVQINPSTQKILDICTGNAPIPLILSTKTKSKIWAVELQKEIYDMAQETIKINKLDDQIELINADAKELNDYFETDSFDIITCNPPYFKVNDDSIINDNMVKSIARHEITINLNDITKISKKLLKNGGSLYLVHRTDRLIDIIQTLKENNLEPKKLRLIYPKKNYDSNIILIEARKNGKSGLKILPPLYVHNENGTYSDEVLEMLGKEK